jgi:glycosyltransferase involved in cell wall biosynthesis
LSAAVVASVDAPTRGPFASEVVAEIVEGLPASVAAAATACRDVGAVIVQHEFGIYGGEDGRDVVDFVECLDPPAIVVLHTVLQEPTSRQRSIIEELSERAAFLVVQSEAARSRLLEHYRVDAREVQTIPHGAAEIATVPVSNGLRPTILSWGLLGPGKGIELGIRAVAELDDLQPPPRYVILGQTHPRVRKSDGEAYRSSLMALSEELGVDDRVEFDDRYHDAPSLLRRVHEADIVLLPYRSREQVVSGVLVQALAAGRPVVATRFPHAEELLAAGSGILVPHDDPNAIAEALRSLLTDPVLASSTRAAARNQARTLSWPAAAQRYLDLVDEVTRVPVSGAATPPRRLWPHRPLPAPPFEHLIELTDGTGVFEHAKATTARREHGYCTDDVARALIAVMREPVRSLQLERLAAVYLDFLRDAQLADGRFHNRRSVERAWLDAVGCDDAIGRALWAAGETAARATRGDQRAKARILFAAGAGFDSDFSRPNAYVALGAAALLSATSGRTAGIAHGALRRAAGRLGVVSADPSWPWPEPRLTYANAVLAEARIAAGAALEDETLVSEGLQLLAWLVATETRDGRFSFTPAGGWEPGETRPGFDQQPIEAAAMADACARAFEVAGEAEWAEHALRAAAWFLGENDVGVALLDSVSGGGRDGLKQHGVNENEGAESTLALITALQQARRLQFLLRRPRTRSRVSTRASAEVRSA